MSPKPSIKKCLGIHAGNLLPVAILAACMISLSFPAEATVISSIICNVVFMIYSSFAAGICVAAVVMVGVGAMFGKASAGLALTVAIGISIIYSAAWIASIMSGGSC